jgi:phosphatidate phosphatase LPIN
VNGRAIPFSMKIGDAGEAFFVFETDAEVPDDLLTSPVLEATRPGPKSAPAADVPAGRFGAKGDPDDASQEPEYFDLDAPSGSKAGHDEFASSPEIEVTTPTDTHGTDIFRQGASAALDKASLAASALAEVADAVRPANFLDTTKAVVNAVAETEREEMDRFRDRLGAAKNMASHLRHPGTSSGMGDEALPDVDGAKDPEVLYRNGARWSLVRR